jgi:hypothetical protein
VEDGLVGARIGASYREVMTEDLPVYRAEGNVFNLLRWGVDLPDLLEAYTGELVRLEPEFSLP